MIKKCQNLLYTNKHILCLDIHRNSAESDIYYIKGGTDNFIPEISWQRGARMTKGIS